VTKVPTAARRFGILLAMGLGFYSFPARCAQAVPAGAHSSGPAESLYLQLSHVGLDRERVFRVRDASLDRPAVHITLQDGTLAFTQDVLGRITGAFFEGEGEVLVVPPNPVERASMSLFTGMAILEERFSTAYFRFNDNSAFELKPGLRAAENAPEFVKRWDETARNLAKSDAMRLLVSFSAMLPDSDATSSGSGPGVPAAASDDRMFHARLQGNKLGVFDLLFDSAAGEQIEVGQARAAEGGTTYYDVWTSFSTDEGSRQAPNGEKAGTVAAELRSHRQDPVVVRRYTIDAKVNPPKWLEAEANLQIEVRRGGERTLVFELSRFLQVERVASDGQPVEFIHNSAVEGTQLARKGDDIVAVILPSPVQTGQKINLRVVYRGEVIAEAGKGLLYVGARGTWYPNRGPEMADFDLTFHYPPGWILVATGKPAPASTAPNDGPKASTGPAAGREQVTRWVSERPFPVAGFNLGRYVRAAVQAGNVTVETYATAGVERNFPGAPAPQVPVDPVAPGRVPHEIMAATIPSPARNAMAVAEATAHAVQYYAERFGPFPYSQLAMTQMPGPESQGWPGLVFLSSFAFLTKEDRAALHMSPVRTLVEQQIPAHETAHQWWGDLITWKTYRDQWFSEGLAEYCSLMMLQERNPAGFQELMEKYRRDLVEKNKDGSVPKEAGPVTLGGRLLSSHFPGGYEAISYGRGTWLFHMLRSMLQDAAAEGSSRPGRASSPIDEPFVRGLRRLRERYAGKAISTSELLEVFAEDLPPSLRYEGKASLDWFLDGWVNGTALPRLQLQGVKLTPKAQGMIVTGTILQKDAPDSLVTSVPIYAAGPGKALHLLGRVFADGPESSFRLSAPAGTRKLLLDPDGTILTSPKN
jgi:Peptidase family M1 domain